MERVSVFGDMHISLFARKLRGSGNERKVRTPVIETPTTQFSFVYSKHSSKLLQ